MFVTSCKPKQIKGYNWGGGCPIYQGRNYPFSKGGILLMEDRRLSLNNALQVIFFLPARNLFGPISFKSIKNTFFWLCIAVNTNFKNDEHCPHPLLLYKRGHEYSCPPPSFAPCCQLCLVNIGFRANLYITTT